MDLNYVVFKGASKDVHIESSMANTSELGSLDSVFVKEVPQSTPLHRPSFLPQKFSPHIWSNFDSKFCVPESLYYKGLQYEETSLLKTAVALYSLYSNRTED